MWTPTRLGGEVGRNGILTYSVIAIVGGRPLSHAIRLCREEAVRIASDYAASHPEDVWEVRDGRGDVVRRWAGRPSDWQKEGF